MQWITVGVLAYDALAIIFVVVALVGCVRGVRAERKAAENIE